MSRSVAIRSSFRSRRLLSNWCGLATGLLLSLAVPLLAQASEDVIQPLREKAERAFDERRWATPAGRCANDLANRILAMEPDDGYALDLKERIVSQYLNLLEKKMSQGDVAAAHGYASRALLVKPGDPVLIKLQQRLARKLPKPKPRAAEPKRDSLIDAFNAADKQASYQGWEAFLSRHPDSEFEDYARRQLVKLGRGRLHVTTHGLTGAPVMLDGELVGHTPLDLDDVPAGNYTLLVESLYRQPYEIPVEIPPDGDVEISTTMVLADPLFQCAARHKHALGQGCVGQLSLHRDRLEFRSDDGPDTMILLWQELGHMDTSHPQKLRVNSIRSRRNYNFDLIDGRLDAQLIKLLATVGRAR